jgi:hypothetical protein
MGRECTGLPSRELKRQALRRVADWWAEASLSMRVVLITDGNLPFMALGLPHMTTASPFPMI